MIDTERNKEKGEIRMRENMKAYLSGCHKYPAPQADYRKGIFLLS